MAEADIAPEWRVVQASPSYEISSEGVVRRCVPSSLVGKSGKGRRYLPGKIMVPRNNRGGYPYVGLTEDGRVKFYTVHRLVTIAFHGPAPSSEHHAAHIDGDRQNSRADNLRWATALENAADKRRHGREAFGSTHRSAKVNEDDVRRIRERHRNGEIFVRIADDFKITPEAVSNIVRRKVWKHVA